MAEQNPEVIDVPDDDDDEDWPEMGPVNILEAKRYVDKITDIFYNLSKLLHSDWKDYIPTTIRSFHRLVVRHWESMSNTDPEVVIC